MNIMDRFGHLFGKAIVSDNTSESDTNVPAQNPFLSPPETLSIPPEVGYGTTSGPGGYLGEAPSDAYPSLNTGQTFLENEMLGSVPGMIGGGNSDVREDPAGEEYDDDDLGTSLLDVDAEESPVNTSDSAQNVASSIPSSPFTYRVQPSNAAPDTISDPITLTDEPVPTEALPSPEQGMEPAQPESERVPNNSIMNQLESWYPDNMNMLEDFHKDPASRRNTSQATPESETPVPMDAAAKREQLVQRWIKEKEDRYRVKHPNYQVDPRAKKMMYAAADKMLAANEGLDPNDPQYTDSYAFNVLNSGSVQDRIKERAPEKYKPAAPKQNPTASAAIPNQEYGSKLYPGQDVHTAFFGEAQNKGISPYSQGAVPLLPELKQFPPEVPRSRADRVNRLQRNTASINPDNVKGPTPQQKANAAGNIVQPAAIPAQPSTQATLTTQSTTPEPEVDSLESVLGGLSSEEWNKQYARQEAEKERKLNGIGSTDGSFNIQHNIYRDPNTGMMTHFNPYNPSASSAIPVAPVGLKNTGITTSPTATYTTQSQQSISSKLRNGNKPVTDNPPKDLREQFTYRLPKEM